MCFLEFNSDKDKYKYEDTSAMVVGKYVALCCPFTEIYDILVPYHPHICLHSHNHSQSHMLVMLVLVHYIHF